MPVTAPIPGGPPQGPHRPLEEQTPSVTPESVSKVAKAAGREGTAASKMQTVSREKLPTGSSWLSRFTNWVSGLFQTIFNSKPKEVTPKNVVKEKTVNPAIQAAEIRTRFQALPADQQRRVLLKMLDVIQERGELGKKGLFREEGEAVKREELKKVLLNELQHTPGENIRLDSEETDDIAATYKTFLGAYLNYALPDEGYEALKRGGSQEEILAGLSGENRSFMESFFDFYSNFVTQQIANKGMDHRGAAVVFAPCFVKDKDDADRMAFMKIIGALEKLAPQG
ncbi:MAG: hypothetical protein LLG04_11615 [Parachlamydia sp.]|nr:hypothetical protein [Parachlamydia sp.]